MHCSRLSCFRDGPSGGVRCANRRASHANGVPDRSRLRGPLAGRVTRRTQSRRLPLRCRRPRSRWPRQSRQCLRPHPRTHRRGLYRKRHHRCRTMRRRRFRPAILIRDRIQNRNRRAQSQARRCIGGRQHLPDRLDGQSAQGSHLVRGHLGSPQLWFAGRRDCCAPCGSDSVVAGRLARFGHSIS